VDRVVFVEIPSLNGTGESSLLECKVLLHYPEEGGTNFLHNFGNYAIFYMALYPRRFEFLSASLW
jgi:hypothetical protein